MLTNNQLYDAMSCSEFEHGCNSCSLQRRREVKGRVLDSEADCKDVGCFRSLVYTALRMSIMIESLEWAATKSVGMNLVPACPVCGHSKSENHSFSCELGAMVRILRGTFREPDVCDVLEKTVENMRKVLRNTSENKNLK